MKQLDRNFPLLHITAQLRLISDKNIVDRKKNYIQKLE